MAGSPESARHVFPARSAEGAEKVAAGEAVAYAFDSQWSNVGGELEPVEGIEPIKVEHRPTTDGV